MKDTMIAVGLAKNVFEIAISREAGKAHRNSSLSRCCDDPLNSPCEPRSL